jgi:hypothetical protein
MRSTNSQRVAATRKNSDSRFLGLTTLEPAAITWLDLSFSLSFSVSEQRKQDRYDPNQRLWLRRELRRMTLK